MRNGSSVLMAFGLLALAGSAAVAQTTPAEPPLREAVFAKFPAQYRVYGGPGPYFPDRAARTHVSGLAVIQCALADNGLLNDCSLISETPKDFGFGDAALKMAIRRAMGAQPRVVDGQRVSGEIVRVAVHFDGPRNG